MFEPKSLLDYWNPLIERCGFILDDDLVIELPNLSSDKVNEFAIDKANFEKYPNVVATWHTHPSGSANLSVADYKVFLTKPELFHYIAGDGIVWGFYIRNNIVFLYEDSDFSRLPKG